MRKFNQHDRALLKGVVQEVDNLGDKWRKGTLSDEQYVAWLRVLATRLPSSPRERRSVARVARKLSRA